MLWVLLKMKNEISTPAFSSAFQKLTTICSWNSEWNLHIHLNNNDNENSLLKRLNKMSKLALEGSQLCWGEVFTQIVAERALEIHENGKGALSIFPSKCQEGGRIKGIWGLVAAATATAVGFGAGLRWGRRTLGLKHAGVGEDEAWVVRSGQRGGSSHHRRVEAVSIRTIHAAT